MAGKRLGMRVDKMEGSEGKEGSNARVERVVREGSKGIE